MGSQVRGVLLSRWSVPPAERSAGPPVASGHQAWTPRAPATTTAAAPAAPTTARVRCRGSPVEGRPDRLAGLGRHERGVDRGSVVWQLRPVAGRGLLVGGRKDAGAGGRGDLASGAIGKRPPLGPGDRQGRSPGVDRCEGQTRLQPPRLETSHCLLRSRVRLLLGREKQLWHPLLAGDDEGVHLGPQLAGRGSEEVGQQRTDAFRVRRGDPSVVPHGPGEGSGDAGAIHGTQHTLEALSRAEGSLPHHRPWP